MAKVEGKARRLLGEERCRIREEMEALWNSKHDAHNGLAHISLSRNDPNEGARDPW